MNATKYLILAARARTAAHVCKDFATRSALGQVQALALRKATLRRSK